MMRRLRPIVRGLVFVLLAFEVVYVVGANLVLNTDILDDVINKKPHKTLIEWESGWTPWPFFVHVEGFRFRSQSAKQQMQFRLGEADVWINLFALPGKRVSARSVSGDDFSFRLRPRLTAETAGDPDGAYFPEIAGLSNPPDPAPEDIYPPKDPSKKKKKWRIDLGNIDIDGRVEIAVGTLLIAGDGTAGGDLRYQVGAEMHLPRAQLGLSDSEIKLRDQVYVNEVTLRADTSLGPFVPKETKGLSIFEYLLGSFSLENGTIPDVSVVNAFLLERSAIRFVDGSASFNWLFQKDSSEEGSHGRMAFAATDASLLMRGRTVSADIAIDANLAAGSLTRGFWDVSETTVALDNVDIRLLRTEEEALTAAASPPTEEDLWWARFTISPGEIDMGTPSDLGAAFRFRMKNTEPLVHLFFAKPNKEGGAELPGWVKFLPDIEALEGSGRVEAGEAGTLLDDIVLRGVDFDLVAILDGRGGAAEGGLFVRYKDRSLGVDVAGGKKDLKILHPKRWFMTNSLFEEQWPILDEQLTEKERAAFEEHAEKLAEKAEKQEAAASEKEAKRAEKEAKKAEKAAKKAKKKDDGTPPPG
jgi:hypothetical protein